MTQPAVPQGFFQKLFDTSFQAFITPSIIKLLYILWIVMAGIFALFFIIAGLLSDPALGIVFLVLSPVLFLFYVITGRVYLELVIVLFQVAENTRLTAERLTGGTSASGPRPTGS